MIHSDPLDIAVQSLICPVSNRRLSEAVMIIPCSCKVNKEVIEKIKVKAEEIFLAIEPTNCPACSRKIFGYCDDLQTRKTVQEFFKVIGQSGKILKIKETLKPWSGPLPSYPGEKGDFVKSKKRKILTDYHFESKNNSIVKSVSFVSKPYECYLTLTFNPSEEFLNYLISREIPVDDFGREHQVILTSHLEHMKKLHALIVNNNDFPKADAEFILQTINQTPHEKPQTEVSKK